MTTLYPPVSNRLKLNVAVTISVAVQVLLRLYNACMLFIFYGDH